MQNSNLPYPPNTYCNQQLQSRLCKRTDEELTWNTDRRTSQLADDFPLFLIPTQTFLWRRATYDNMLCDDHYAAHKQNEASRLCRLV